MEPTNQQLGEEIKGMQVKIDAIYISVEKTRRYFLIVTILTVVVTVLPLIGLVFAIPKFLSSYQGYSSLLGQ